MTWREDVETALKGIGGVGSLAQIYDAVEALRGDDLPNSYEAIVRRELEYNSSDSESYKGRFDLFYSVQGIGSGMWGLRELITETPEAIDVAPPERVATHAYRILRDTKMAREIKGAHLNLCQVCDTVLKLPNGLSYAEAHHLRPLGAPHHGPDIASNIIVVCPNHHALLDYGAIELRLSGIRDHNVQGIDQQFIDYHNSVVVEAAAKKVAKSAYKG